MKRTVCRWAVMLAILPGAQVGAAGPVGLWEKVEITLQAARAYENPYKDVEVWVDLAGPGFKKRCYGFWDGGKTFRVRVTAVAPGTWTWRSGASKTDSGLAGAKAGGKYSARWFDSRTGKWVGKAATPLTADAKGKITLPPFPGGAKNAKTDWALKLKLPPKP